MNDSASIHSVSTRVSQGIEGQLSAPAVNPADVEAERIVDRFLFAFGDFDAEKAMTYVADDAELSTLIDGQALSGYDGGTWLALAAIIVGPQLLGHTVINLVLKDLDATTVAISIMAEPIIAAGLAYVLFSETPSALIYPGGAAILVGIYLVSTVGRAQVVVE